MRETKHSLLTSITALLLCFMMLVGTTLAWFTDIVSSSGNVIQSGTLDIDLAKGSLTDSGWVWESTDGKAIFNYEKWEPGYTTTAVLAVENHGTLSAKWIAKLELDGTPTILADVIDIYVTSYHNYSTTRPDFTDGTWQKLGTVSDVLNNEGMLLPGETIDPGRRQPILVALNMRTDAGNEYQDMDLGANFNIKILATQATTESDSFGNDYDIDAKWPTVEGGESASAAIDRSSLLYGSLTNAISIKGDGFSATVPEDVKIADGATSLNLTVKSADADGNITYGDDGSATGFDVHIDGIAADNTVPVIVNLGAILPAGLDGTELKLYHTENGTPTQMTRVNSSADFAIHNQYTYDPTTGAVSIYVASFSVFSAVKTTADLWDGTSNTSWYNENDTEFTLESAEQFAGFRDLVDGGNTFEGKTVKLGVDIDLTRIPFDPIGFGYWNESKVDANGNDKNTVFMGTFDGGNHTIYNLYENCWELDTPENNYSTYTYSTAGAGLFASIKDATIKNLAVSGAEIVFECVDMGVVVGYAQGECQFENIVVTDAKIANYNRYTGGLVGEVSYGVDNNKDGYSHTFKNITIDSTVTVSGLWGSFGCGMGGVIGGKWGDATVLMENVISAPVMDVYNDVVSAYQWYAFRGCGMLIGHTEEPYSDGRHSGIATANFLKCENVKVYYGDWVNYTYYEFAEQKDAEGNTLWYSNYPWVRAEAGEYCDAFSNIRYGIPLINGVKVTELSEEDFNAAVTSTTKIIFDQLYGADRGMYGQAKHEGVTVIDSNKKTIYIQNNLGWENLKVHYWYVNGEDTWTNINTDGVDLTEENGVYRVDLPAYAHAFNITADDENVTDDFVLSTLEDGEHINLNGEHIHYFVDNNCVCGAVRQIVENYTFNLGENGEAKHSDGGNEVTTFEENGYTLTLTGTSSLYGNARDAKGNSCIKLGTGSLIGKFSFTVPENIDRVVLYVAGYKDNNVTIVVNNVQHEITTLSNNGEYTAIEVDTSTTKTVSLTTVNVNSEPRCMINAISFAITDVIEVHDCDENAEIPAVEPTCTETGLTAGKACSICSKPMVEQGIVPATGHTEETIPAVDATCTKNGLTEGTKCSVCDDILVEQEIVLSTGHNYVESTCSVCGAAFPTASGTYTYVFSEYTAGTQYAKGEEHKLDDYVTITTYDCHFTEELRIYSSSTNNGYAIIYSANPISKIAVNAGNKVDTINIYGSDDGINWTAEPIATISVTDASYNDYTAELKDEYKYLKLDVAGSYQIRIKSMTLTTVPDCVHTSTTTETVDPTCTEAGYTVEKCASCGKEMNRTNEVAATGHVNTTTDEKAATCTEDGYTKVTCACGHVVSNNVIPATGEHTYVDGICTGCGAAEPTTPETPVESGWIETDLADIKANDIVVIVWTTNDGTSYAISNDKGAGSAPAAVVVTVNGNTLTGNIADNIKWNISNSNGSLTIYPNGTTSTWLYCTNSNNGVRVGTNTNKAFTIDATSGYLKNTATSRYLGVYTTNPDVRCYTNTTGNTANQTIAFYKWTEGTTGGETTCEHANTTTTTVDATCTTTGVITVICDDCGVTVSTEETAALGHTTDDGVCDRCSETIGGSEPVIDTLAKFTFGANGTASHSDGSSKSSYSETNNGYTLTLSSMTNVYTDARDAKGNSCIKLGASSKAGSFSFTVNDDVTKVVIYVAQYKANATKITANGTSYTITTASNNGAYTAIEIDTSTTKTITLTTVSGGYRAMINTIEFYG